MKNPERLIGKKVRGFKFDKNTCCGYSEYMDRFIGVEGIIKHYQEYNKSFSIKFTNDYDTWNYPADQIEDHLVEDETYTFNANHNKMKLEDEIPTLSDGVMMLVSFNDISWHERKVIGKKNGVFYGWNGDSILAYKSVKQIEPTKEEQLTAILGSSEKVSEIMELFKN